MCWLIWKHLQRTLDSWFAHSCKCKFCQVHEWMKKVMVVMRSPRAPFLCTPFFACSLLQVSICGLLCRPQDLCSNSASRIVAHFSCSTGLVCMHNFLGSPEVFVVSLQFLAMWVPPCCSSFCTRESWRTPSLSGMLAAPYLSMIGLVFLYGCSCPSCLLRFDLFFTPQHMRRLYQTREDHQPFFWAKALVQCVVTRHLC